jgi:hypothetical protein
LDEVTYRDERHRLLFEQTYVPAEDAAPTRGAAGAPTDIPIIDSIAHLPTFNIITTFRTHMGLLNADPIVDAAGNTFTAVRFQDGNYTRVYVRKTAPNGAIVGEWAGIGPGGWKIDGMGLSASGPDLLVEAVAHDLPNPPPPDGRLSADGIGTIPGVFVPFGNQLPKAGEAGAFVPQIEQEPQVDYDQIRAIVQAGIDDLAARFGDDGIRQGIKDKAGDAMQYMMSDSPEWKVRNYQDALFAFVKNANAGVQANILGGQDPWGAARREELKQIIREVLAEG